MSSRVKQSSKRRRARVASIAALATIGGFGISPLLATAAHADPNPGVQALPVDTSFGTTNGVATTMFSNSAAETPNAATVTYVQPNGNVLVGGYVGYPSTSQSGVTYRVALVRYTPNGQLDQSFGDHGVVLFSHGPYTVGDSWMLNALTELPNGDIVIAAQESFGGPDGYNYSYLYAFDAQGNPIASWAGGAGRIDPSTGTPDIIQINGLAYDPSTNRIYATGTDSPDGMSSSAIVLAYNPDGTPATDFGTNGAVTVDPNGDAAAAGNAVTVQPDGKIVVAGGSNYVYGAGLADDFVLRLNPDGSLDSTFGTNPAAPGIADNGLGGASDYTSVTIDEQGNIYAGGAAPNSAPNTVMGVVDGFTPSGQVDNAFAGGEYTTTAIESVGQVVAGDAGLFVVGSSSPSGAVAQFVDTTGTLKAQTLVPVPTTGDSAAVDLEGALLVSGDSVGSQLGLSTTRLLYPAPPAPAPAPTPAPSTDTSTVADPTTTTNTTPPPASGGNAGQVTPTPPTPSATTGDGYWLVTPGGVVKGFGGVGFFGQPAGSLSQPAVAIAATPDKGGYWVVTAGGTVYAYGDATSYGSVSGTLSHPIVGIAATPSGQGYWLVASDGGVFAFGDAQFYGSMGGKPLNKPVVGMAVTPSGHGYWLVASDGGIFTFGDAQFYGSTGSMHLNQPVVGMAATASGQGYWLVAADGGVFTFGDGQFYGSMGGSPLNKPVIGMERSASGNGYRLIASDGGVFDFGDAAFYGSGVGAGLGTVAGLS